MGSREEFNNPSYYPGWVFHQAVFILRVYGHKATSLVEVTGKTMKNHEFDAVAHAKITLQIGSIRGFKKSAQNCDI